MIRIFGLILMIIYSCDSFGQTTNDAEVEVKLFLPTHLKNEITATDKLVVYFTTFPDDTIRKYPKKIVAKKVEQNVYTFPLPTTKLWHIGFSIGPYSAAMLCINNRDGNASENYTFNILLKKEKVDFANMQFLPPCVRGDDE